MRDPPDPDCDDRPYETALVITTSDGTEVVKEFKSGKDGKFYVDLPPGEYSIRAAAGANSFPHCSSTDIIRVNINDSTEANVSCDTGIR
jgi:hypothetical protein